MKSTTDYSIFKIRQDNRSLVPHHIKDLKNSLLEKNMLKQRPILVNENMEIIDGQHRLEAARDLNLTVWYEIREDLDHTDIILLNVAKSWKIADYLKYYVAQGVEEYIKLHNFVANSNLQLKTALVLSMGQGKQSMEKFKRGCFIFEQRFFEGEIEKCWETIGLIKKLNGVVNFTQTNKFWIALTKLIQHPDFNYMKWRANLSKLSDRMCTKATSLQYLRIMQDIYNYHNMHRIDFGDKI